MPALPAHDPPSDSFPPPPQARARRTRSWLFRLGPIVGLAALAWFLIRVIPKPSRASYPCQRAAFPIATGFILWITGLLGGSIFLGKARQLLAQAKYAPALACFILAAFLAVQWWNAAPDNPAIAATYENYLLPNHPVGAGKGIFPGRVTWVYDPSVSTWDGNSWTTTGTDNYRAHGYWGQNPVGHSAQDWLSPRAVTYTNQSKVDDMMAASIHWLTGTTGTLENANDTTAGWDRLFRYFNKTHYNYNPHSGEKIGLRGDAGYAAGEKIFIKCNWVNTNGGTGGAGHYYAMQDSGTSAYSRRFVDTNVEVFVALLQQLTAAGVSLSDISMGDPDRDWPIAIYRELVNTLGSSDFKLYGVHDYFDGTTQYQYAYKTTVPDEDDPPNTRPTAPWYTSSYLNPNASPPITDFSNYTSKYNLDHVPDCWENATYIINLALFKTHARNAVSLVGKSYIGALGRSPMASRPNFDLHAGLMSNSSNSINYSRDALGLYRSLVDLGGHRKLGGNVVLNITDALYCGYDWSGTVPPQRWYSLPLHTDPNDETSKYWWSSSIFMSVDPVAIDAVETDVWKIERWASLKAGHSITALNAASQCNPTRTGVEDYMLEMAMAGNPLSGTIYKPDGVNQLASMGAFETLNITGSETGPDYGGTWENYVSDSNLLVRKYSRNTGAAPGVELIMSGMTLTPALQQIAGRNVFYNNSDWDGNNADANADDDAAIAPDKIPLLPGGAASFFNYTSYDKGVNGVMIDVYDVTGDAPADADFICTVGNDNAADDGPHWSVVHPSSVTIRPTAGHNDSARITLTFADGSIVGKWLRVHMIANPAKNLPEDIFYIGNAPGETGNSATDARVDAADQVFCRNDPHNLVSDPADITNHHDFNRDKKVDTSDELISRNNVTYYATDLQLITPPVPAPPAP